MGIESDLHAKFHEGAPSSVRMSVVEATMLFTAFRLEEMESKSQCEESISSALWGAIGAAFPFCAEFIGTDSEIETDCYWGHFKKTRVAAGASAGWDHESKSGADFALAFSDVEGDFWVAVFQAKKADEDELDLYRRSEPATDGTWRVSQLLALVEYGENVLESLRREQSIRIRKMHWIHYVAYHKSGFYCARLSDLVGPILTELTADRLAVRTTNRVGLNSGLFVPFSEVLLNGVALARKRRKSFGWLRIPKEKVSEFLPALMKLTEVHVVDEGRGGCAAAIESLPDQGCVEKRQATPKTSVYAPAPTPPQAGSAPGPTGSKPRPGG